MAAVPIWKDKTFGIYDSTYFRLLVGGEVIYNGRAVKRPGETSVRVRVNDICADWLRNVLPTLDAATFDALTFPVTFSLQRSTLGSNWANVGTVQFLNDWSYDYHHDSATMGMYAPITGRVDARQYLTFTTVSASTVTARFYLKDGTSFSQSIPVEIQPSFSGDFNTDFARSTRSAGAGTAVFCLADFYQGDTAAIERVTIGNAVYYVTTDCAEYCLYYVNAYGGWDSLLIEGAAIPGDTLTRYERKVFYDNTNQQNRGTQNYVNDIERTYTLHTGPLDSAASRKMHHLLNSPEVYLCEIGTGDVVPVVLTDTQHEYRTVKENGRQFVDYAIAVKVAQQFERR